MSGKRLFWLVLLILLVALALHLRYAVGRFQVGIMLARVEAASLQAATAGRLSRTLLEHNLRTLDRASTLAPAEVLVPIQRAGQYVLMGRHDRAVAAYNDALGLEPRSEIYRNLGQAQWSQGQKEEAQESFLRAVWLDHVLIRQLGKYLPQKRRMEGGSLILYEDFESGRFGVAGLGRQVVILKDGFEPAQEAQGFPRPEK